MKKLIRFKKMKSFLIGLISLMIQAQMVYSQADKPFSQYPVKFTSYMEQVSKHNLDYAAEKFEVSKAEAAIEIAKVFPDPTFAFGMTRNREGQLTTGHDISTELDVPVELFGKRRARIDLAKSQHELSKALLSDFFRNLEADAATVFLEALKQKQQIGRAHV